MTQYNRGPIDYYTPWRAVFVRPVGVTVIAWIGIVLGALGIICGGLGLLASHVMLARMNAISGGIHQTSTPAQTVAAIVGLAQSAVLLLASVGCLHLRPTARRVLIGYAIFAIAWELAMVLMTHLLFRSAFEQTGAIIGPARQVLLLNVLMMSIGLVLRCALPAAILYVMTRPHVKNAFASGGMTWSFNGMTQAFSSQPNASAGNDV